MIGNGEPETDRKLFGTALVMCALFLTNFGTPALAQMDDHFRRQPAETGGHLQAFGVDVYPDGPIAIEQVNQIRQAYGRHRFAVNVKNRSSSPVVSYALVGVVVGSDGSVKAVQPLPPIKNLKPGQSRRQEFDLRSAVLGLSDTLAFAVSEVQSGADAWKVTDADLKAAIKAAASKFQRPH